MGVTKRSEVQFKNPDHNSTESLHIPISSSQTSLASAVSSESIPVPRPPRRQKRQRNLSESPINLSRNAGRRRQRRVKAVAELTALIEENESEIFLEEGIPHCSPFTTIIENPEFKQILDDFTADEEFKQVKLLDFPTTVPKRKTLLASYANISFHIKMTFKMMRSLCELERTESEIIEFFTNFPEDPYVHNDKSSFQRLLIHGVAQYYCLKSISFDAEGGKRSIKVENPNNYRDFCNKRLFAIVKDNHKKRV